MKFLIIGLALLFLAWPARAQSQLSLSLSLSFDATGFSGADLAANFAPSGLNHKYTLSFDPLSLQEAQLTLNFGGDASPIRGTVSLASNGFKSLTLKVNLNNKPAFTLKGNASLENEKFDGKFEGQLASGPLFVSGKVHFSHKGIKKLAVSVSATARVENLNFTSTTHAELSGFTRQDFRWKTALGDFTLSGVTVFNPQGFVSQEVGTSTSIMGFNVSNAIVFDIKGFKQQQVNINMPIEGGSVSSNATFDVHGFKSATLTADGVFAGLLLNGSASFDKSGFQSSDFFVSSTLFEVLSLDGQLTLNREGVQYGHMGLSTSIGLLTLNSSTTFVAGQFQHDIGADVSLKF